MDERQIKEFTLLIINKWTLLGALKQRIHNESSSFSKMLLQANLVSFYMVVTLDVFDFSSNHAVPVKDISFIRKGTLGQQKLILRKYLSNEIGYWGELQSFIDKRNAVTHRACDVFKDMEELESACEEAVVAGESLLKKMSDFRKKMLD